MVDNSINKSLFIRSAYNMFELLERLFLEPNEPLSKFNEEELKRGIGRFREAMVLISKNSEMKKGCGYRVPFIIYKEGNC